MASVTIKKNHGKILKIITATLRRFHLLIFFIISVGCVSFGVIMLNKTLTETSPQDYTSTIHAGSIDKATLERIQSLHASGDASQIPLPDGRINPFAE